VKPPSSSRPVIVFIMDGVERQRKPV